MNAVTCIAFAALAGPASAENDVVRLTCSARSVCDSQGSCAAASEAMKFEFTAVETGMHGEGKYQLKREDVVVDAVLLGTLAHYLWQEGDEMKTLLFGGGSRFVLHSLSLADPPDSKTIFMTCKAA